MKRLRNFGKFHVSDNSPLNLCSSPLLHKVAKAQYGQTCQALEWVEATLTRLYMGKVGTVLGGLRRMQATSAEALKAIDNCWVYLNDHRGRTHYGKFRRGGYPLGSGGHRIVEYIHVSCPAQALRCLVVRSHQQSDVGAALRHV